MHRRSLVAAARHLVHIPVGSEIAEIYHLDISANSLHLLGVPEREGIVVAVTEHNGVRLKTLEIVDSEIAGGVTAAPVMIIPCLAHHLHRNDKTDNESDDSGIARQDGIVAPLLHKTGMLFGKFSGIGGTAGCCRDLHRILLFFSHEEGDELPQCGHTHAYPDGPRIETAGEGIVTLAWLLRRLVKIEHYRDTCHEEEEKYHPELLYTTLSGECLPKEAGYAEKQRKHEITVVARIVLTQIVRQQRLVAKTRVIDKRYARYPVSCIKFS